MSDSPDISDNDPIDDKRLSALYDHASTEQPSASIDHAILAKARSDIRKPARQSNFFTRWTHSFSVAAVLVLSVSVIFMIDKESPELLKGTESVMDLEQEISHKATTPTKKPVRQEKQKLKRTVTLAEPALPDFSLSGIATIKSESILEEKLDNATPSAVANTQAPAPQITAEMNDNSIAAQSGRVAQPRKEQDRLVVTELESSVALRKNIPVIKNKIAAKTKARKKQTARSLESKKAKRQLFKPSPAASPSALSFSEDRSNDKMEETRENRNCKSLTEKECLASTTCTLRKNKALDSYQCENATDPCEINFRQGAGTKETCVSVKNCVFVPSACYCHPDVLCICAGGEPSHCKSNSTTE